MKKSHVFRNSIVAMISMIILVAISYHWFDITIAQWFTHQSHGLAYQVSKNIFANIFDSNIWLFVAVISLAVGLLSLFLGKQKQAKPWLFFSYANILAFMLCMILKFIFARYRPELYFSQGLYGFHFFSIKHPWNSMPSGHATATFAGCYALATLFKRQWLTVLLILVALLVAMSRLVIGAHYLSDVILGADLGVLSVYWIKVAIKFNRSRSLF